jgi:hypothetical protein
VLRPSAGAVAGDKSAAGWLIVQGVLGKQEVALLHDLFAACAQYRMKPKATLTAEDVSTSERARIQNDKKYSNIFELPGNWWFNGQYYIDISGNQRQLRPDIDRLVERYVVDENIKIDAYNALIAEMI